jgi:hypothetical protein
MLQKVDSLVFKYKLKQMFFVLIAVFFALGLNLSGWADPYQEATAGHESVVGLSYFGTHFHRLVLNPGEKNLQTIWPKSTVGAVRLWDSGTLWSEIAIQPGQWKYDRIDAYVEQATKHHADILYTLGGTPRWASARPEEKCPYGMGCAAEPVKMAHWEEYVRRVVQRYRGRIKAYELWNEPKFSDIPRDRNSAGFYTGSIASMVEMARIARKVLDENDPAALLSTPGFVNGPDRLELFLAAGGKKYVQAISYHLYAADSDRFVSQIIEVRNIMKRQGLENLPLWNTETGVEVKPPGSFIPADAQALTYIEAADQFAQFLVLGAAAGVEHFYHYAWDNERSGMMNRLGEALPNQFAFDKVQAWLLDAKMLGCKKILPHAVMCVGERAGANFAIAWANKNGAYVLSASSPWEMSTLEHLMDTRDAKSPLSKQAATDKIELGPQPLLIQYKNMSGNSIN